MFSIEKDGDKERCPECGEWYQRLGLHWNRSSCDYPKINDDQWGVLRGFIMGDGSLDVSPTTPRIIITMTNWRFLTWVDSELAWLTRGVRMSDTSVQQSGMKPSGRYTSAENSYDMYRVRTRCHPQLSKFKSWYQNGRTVFPRDLSISPMTMKMWYASDGGLDWNQSGNSRVCFHSRNESERPGAIVGALEEYGFTVCHSDSQFILSVSDKEKFFNIVGEAPPGFEYKWAYEDREKYDEDKRYCEEECMTQTFEDKPPKGIIRQ